MVNLKKITQRAMPIVIGVTPLRGHKLLLVFSTGEIKVYDCSWFLQYPVGKELNDPEFFRRAHVWKGTVAWSRKVDLAPETLYADSILLKDSQGEELMVG